MNLMQHNSLLGNNCWLNLYTKIHSFLVGQASIHFDLCKFFMNDFAAKIYMINYDKFGVFLLSSLAMNNIEIRKALEL